MRTSMTNQSVAPGSVVTDIDQLQDNLVATGIIHETGGSITTDGAEQTILMMNAPMGIAYVTTVLFDLDAMVGGDTIVFKTYLRITPGGGLQLADYDTYTGIDGGLPNGEKLTDVGGAVYRFGYMLSIQRTAGADHPYPWSAFLVGE